MILNTIGAPSGTLSSAPGPRSALSIEKRPPNMPVEPRRIIWPLPLGLTGLDGDADPDHGPTSLLRRSIDDMDMGLLGMGSCAGPRSNADCFGLLGDCRSPSALQLRLHVRPLLPGLVGLEGLVGLPGLVGERPLSQKSQHKKRGNDTCRSPSASTSLKSASIPATSQAPGFNDSINFLNSTWSNAPSLLLSCRSNVSNALK
mmetsp:Transcript_86412/g.249319  ORF Transcript_86412/g.249319 Transcript_86412/m.249319 type:complete len:202 (+) Transcript_86412:342-947(+)